MALADKIRYGHSMVKATLIRLPMPPQSNHLYGYNKKAGKRFKNKAHPFFNGMEQFEVLHFNKLKKIQTVFKEYPLVRIDRYFCFHYSSLYTKDGRIKKMDVSNRIKAFDDELAKLTGIDDSRMWVGYEEKIEVPDNEEECATVVITPITKPRTRKELLNELQTFDMGTCLCDVISEKESSLVMESK